MKSIKVGIVTFILSLTGSFCLADERQDGSQVSIQGLEISLSAMAEYRRVLLQEKNRLESNLRDALVTDYNPADSFELLSVVREIELLDQQRKALVTETNKVKPPSMNELADSTVIAARLSRYIDNSSQVIYLVTELDRIR